MAHYEFITIWRLQAPIEQVHAAIEDSLTWPEWWPSVLAVEELAPGGETAVGGVRRYTMRGRLPYVLSFDMRVTEHDRPTRLVGAATGELEGEGRWTLASEGSWTSVRYEWDVRTTRPWMNLLAPLPFVDAIFRLNHHSVMRDGLNGLSRRLGVPGTYARLD